MKPQTARVLAVLRDRPVTLADFDCQPACDGGDRITRLGARIQDLKDDGYRLRSERIGHIARYTLVAEPESSKPAGVTGSSGQATRADSVTAISERNMVVEKPCPPVSNPQLSLLDGIAA